jgi:hypothetical protein
VYLTDLPVPTRRPADDGSGEMADVEDSHQLDIVRIPRSDLRARQLRVVAPA